MQGFIVPPAQADIEYIIRLESENDYAGAANARYNTILGVLQSSNAGSMDILATNEGAVAMVAGMFVDAARAQIGGAVIDPERLAQYEEAAYTVLGIKKDSISQISSFINYAVNTQDASVGADLHEALSTIAKMKDEPLKQIIEPFTSNGDPDLPTAQALYKLMQLRDAVMGTASGADDLAGDALFRATSSAYKSVSIDTGNPDLDDAMLAAAATAHNLDIVRERWGVAGVHYIGNLIQSGHAKEAALIITLPSDAKAVIVAEENMLTGVLNQDAILAQVNAAAQDLQNPHIMKNSAKRAEQQALLALQAELTDGGALGDLSGFEQSMTVAERTLHQSKGILNRAVQTEQAKWNTLAQAQTRFVANLVDTNAMNAVHTAFGDFWNASTARKKAQQAVAGSQQVLTDARQKLDSARQTAMANVEAQARQKLEEQRLKLAEERARVKEQAEVQAGELGDIPLDQPLPDNVSNKGDEGNPLAQTGESDIINEGTQEEAGSGAGDAGGPDGQITEGAGDVGQYTQKVKWGIQDVEVRPAGKGFFGQRTQQINPRADAYELKINPNDESYYLKSPSGGYVQYENMVNDVVIDGKLVMQQKSFYHVNDLPEFARNKVLQEAMRQVEAANNVGCTVEWLISDPKAVAQLTVFFKSKKINIIVKYFPE